MPAKLLIIRRICGMLTRVETFPRDDSDSPSKILKTGWETWCIPKFAMTECSTSWNSNVNAMTLSLHIACKIFSFIRLLIVTLTQIALLCFVSWLVNNKWSTALNKYALKKGLQSSRVCRSYVERCKHFEEVLTFYPSKKTILRFQHEVKMISSRLLHWFSGIAWLRW